MACWIQLVRSGVYTKAHRQTNSAVYHVFQGEGYTIINGEHFAWKPGDFFVVPPWAWHEHANDTHEDAILFSVTRYSHPASPRTLSRAGVRSRRRPSADYARISPVDPPPGSSLIPATHVADHVPSRILTHPPLSLTQQLSCPDGPRIAPQTTVYHQATPAGDDWPSCHNSKTIVSHRNAPCHRFIANCNTINLSNCL